MPVFRLDCPQQSDFLELVVEAQDDKASRPWFYHLQGLGLEPAIRLAERAVRSCRDGSVEPLVYWTNPKLPLSQWAGVALALAAAVVAAADPRCAYDEILCIGQLDDRGGDGLQVADAGYTGRSLAAVAALGLRPRPACLLLPEAAALGPREMKLLAELDRHGIRPCRVGSLESLTVACRQDAAEAGSLLA